jgi:hypothetical protein
MFLKFYNSTLCFEACHKFDIFYIFMYFIFVHMLELPGLSRGKVRSGRAADHSPPSSAAVMEE